MGPVLLRAFSFAFIIAIGIFLRQKGWIHEEAGHVAQKLMLWVTLPAAAIVNFSTLEKMTLGMAVLPLLAILITFSTAIIILLIKKRKPNSEKVAYTNTSSGVNIGNFCLPFAQSFFPGLGTVALCLYDVGNSVFCLGGVYALTNALVNNDSGKFNLKNFLKTLFSSFTLDIYLVLLILALFGIRPPKALSDFVQPMADSNTFIAMIMLGLTFRIEFHREYLGKIVGLLAWRYLFSALFSLAVWFFLPLDVVIKQVLIIILFGPVNTVAGVYTAKSKGNEGLVSCVTSVSVVTSLIIISGLLVLFNAM